ncbi:MAG: TIGR04338 family metallohydrolase, partial [Gordonia sp. (in: high G+C Gram-positive bacteria)]
MSASAVYDAERLWSAMLDRGGVVDFHGSHLQIPMQKRFADVPSAQRYADGLLASDVVREAYPAAGPVRVRERRGQTRAHYEPGTSTIAVPMGDRTYGRESVLLHETAHHLSASAGLSASASGTRWHGAQFQDAMLFLVGVALG